MDYAKFDTLTASGYTGICYQVMKSVWGTGFKPYVDIRGNARIGTNINLVTDFDAVVDSIFPNIDARLKILLEAEVNKAYAGGKSATLRSNLDAVLQNWAATQDASIRKTFDLSSEVQLKTLLLLSNGFLVAENAVEALLGSALPDSREKAVLVSIAQENPDLLEWGLSAHLQAGDRARGWFEIRYELNSDGTDAILTGAAMADLVRRRYIQSDYFGLYNDQKQVGYAEARHVALTYGSLRNTVLQYEDAYGVASAAQGGGMAAQLQPAIAAITKHFDVPDIGLEEVLFIVGSATTMYGDGTAYDSVRSDEDLIVGNSVANRIFGGQGGDLLLGLDGNDRIDGGSGADYIYAGMGNDTAFGGLGNDRIFGEDGDDVLYAGVVNVSPFGNVRVDQVSGGDYLDGGKGSDKLFGDTGSDTLVGGDGNDTVRGGSGNDRLDGGAGDDELDGEAGNDTIIGGAGRDVLIGAAGNDRLYGDSGNDILLGGIGADRLWGGSGNDRLVGDAGNDWLYGGLGDDRLYGGADNDLLSGDDGNDRLYGQAGNDRLSGGAGNDILDGGAGRDVLFGGAGDDRLTGSDGDDTLNGGSGKDNLDGGEGADNLDGGDRSDVLTGGFGNDLLDGGKGNDRLTGGAGNDRLRGGNGDDVLNGGAGSDRLYGGRGNDVLTGDSRYDVLVGGSGNDIYRIVAETDDPKRANALPRVTGADIVEQKNGGYDTVIVGLSANYDFHNIERFKLADGFSGPVSVELNDFSNFVLSGKADHLDITITQLQKDAISITTGGGADRIGITMAPGIDPSQVINHVGLTARFEFTDLTAADTIDLTSFDIKKIVTKDSDISSDVGYYLLAPSIKLHLVDDSGEDVKVYNNSTDSWFMVKCGDDTPYGPEFVGHIDKSNFDI